LCLSSLHPPLSTLRHPSLAILHRLFIFLSPPPPPPSIYTLSLHDALPILPSHWPPPLLPQALCPGHRPPRPRPRHEGGGGKGRGDRKSTRLNSSHGSISYAVFCLKKKRNNSTEVMLGTVELHVRTGALSMS